MSRSNRLSIIVAAGAGIVSIAALLMPMEAANQEGRPIQVSVDEIGKSLILVGRLKNPLGTIVTVRGKWSHPEQHAKDSSLRFIVSHVDRKKLDEPVKFAVAQLDIVTKEGETAMPPLERHEELVGIEWTIRAFETGSIEIIPEEYWKERPPYAVPYYFRTFTSKLTGVLQP